MATAVAHAQQCCKNLHCLLTQGIKLNSLSTTRNWKSVVFSVLRRLAATTLLGAVIVAVGACATLEKRSPEEAVAERAKARWDALLKNDIKSAYEYLSPATRSTTSMERYGRTITPGFWKAASVGKVKCVSRTVCIV